MLQFKRHYLTSVVLWVLAVYAFLPTESETSTFPMIVRTFAACLIMLTALISVLELRFQFSIPLVFLIFYFTVLAVISFSFRYFVVLVVVSSAFVWAVAFYQSQYFRRATVLALNLLLYFSIGFLLLQFVEYYLFGRLFDYHNLLFPWSEARLPLWSSLARVGGVYLEPGSYANWMYVFLLLRLFLDRSVNFTLVPLVAFTMAFSMSAWGVLVGAFVLFVYSFGRLDRAFVFYLICGLIGIYVAGSLLQTGDILAFMEAKLFYSGSRDVRDSAFQEFISTFPEWIVFGLGFGKVFCVDCSSPQDAGVLISLIVVYGAPLALFALGAIFVFAYRQGGWHLAVLALPLITTKIFYWEPVFWFIFMISLLGLLLEPYVAKWNPEGVDEITFLRKSF